MARKIPGGNNIPTATPSKPTGRNTKDTNKKPKGGSFFGFGRKKQIEKSRENLREAEDFEDDLEFGEDDYEEPIHTPYDGQRYDSQQPQNQQQYQEDFQEDYQEEYQEEPQQRPAPKRGRKGNTTQGPNNPSYSKEPSPEINTHINFQQAENIYDRREMDQSVFLYVKNDYFPVIQHHFNEEFTNIRTIGTSSLDQISNVFATRAISKYIMLFVLEHNEIAYIRNFINSLQLEQIQPNVLNILLILDSKMRVEDLLTTEHQRKFVRVTSINQEKTPITKSILNKLMSVVVEKQPSYIPPEKEVIAPKRVQPNSLTKDISRLNSNDLTSLRQAITDVKRASYDSDLRKEVIGSILRNDDAKVMLDKVENIPHLKLIKSVEEEVEEHLQLIKNNPRMKSEVEEMISRKLLLATMRTSEMEEIISDLIDSAVSRIENVDGSLRDYNRNAVQELKDTMGSNNQRLSAKREEIKADISERFGQYKGLIQLISNSANVQIQSFIETKHDLGKAVSENRANLSKDMLTVTTNQIQVMDSRSESYKNQVVLSQGRMIEALDITNRLLEDYKILVALDDILITSLMEENEVLRQMQPVRVNVESVFKSNGVNIISLPGSGMLTILDTFLDKTDLVIYYGGRNLPKEIMNIEQYTLKDFLSSSWDRPSRPHLINLSFEKQITNPMEIIDQTEFDITNKSVMERLISKLDYVSPTYSNIYVIYEPTEQDINNIHSDITFKYFTEHLKNIVVWSQLNRGSAVMTSMINDTLPDGMHSVKVFLNKVPKEYAQDLEEFKRIVNKPITTLIIPFISNIESQIGSGKKQIIQALKNIKNRMR